MKIKRIILKNIRSYEYQEITFPEGSVLLSGDIGSGKTSILLAIEFALFGLQPGQKGSSLLRNGQVNGGVEIEFEVDNKTIIIERTLKKTKSISQDYCSISIDGDKKEISVTELKSKVLEILNYPKEFSKKQNILYKFTVYTPQEEMKQIILEDSETRINTLRHVFGIDKYKKILENASVLIAKVREEKRIKDAITSNLEHDKLHIETKEKELSEKSFSILSFEDDLKKKSEKRKIIQEEKEEIFRKIDEKRKLQQEIEKTIFLRSTKEDTISSNSRMMTQLKSQIQELKDLDYDEKEIEKLEKDISELKLKKQELNEQNIHITSLIHSLNSKNSDNEKVKEKLKHLEVCPTCLQEVDPVYKSNVVNQMDSDTSANNNLIKENTEKKEAIRDQMLKLDYDSSIKEKRIHELRILKVRLRELDDKQRHLTTLEKTNLALTKDLEMLDSQINLLKSSVFELNKYDNINDAKQRELNEALREEKLAEIKVAELKREIEVFSRQINEMKERVKKTEEIKQQAHYLSDLEEWLSKKFIPIILVVEKNVFTKLKIEFSKLFSKWFSMLVSDSFNVRLSEDFTPIIEQQDYEIDYAYLSGGERTAIALAYRLALNQVINSFLSKIKTRDLVILDEPTDGFSEQQLDKMREVLDELNVSQLIIVSHEQKIESFVDNVIKFKKENGRSIIETK
ncbi:MAG: DNA double-strand break repair Rad50 ATPase [Candidatus Diapherotrites archaeon ADurb.Bin253]|mgnify:FL=1|jgi:exonuclease SbcC|nr:MAG: DNA double-strand break repair Rad50 ATPase [Candidatus Diapherotrites archaeon ADurb.Bin253]HNZ51734.1 SMC family ATPase [Candidatus Pacearchaeota archaeon]HOC97007.1 SMC family ATPase [Candidatus Pacearchaeota archaeon]HOH03854.1 SMC family ATPase [Candidatus Pacearchaeota archaeon]HPX74328.1 SMC family ATPase [Candidatus Pacearchaeota archaeon]